MRRNMEEIWKESDREKEIEGKEIEGNIQR